MTLDWRIYYADGSVYDNLQGEPWEAPATKVLLILQKDINATNGAYLVWKKDYYLWKYDKWVEVDYPALILYWFMEKFPYPKASLAGETVDNYYFEHITMLAKADKDFF